MISFCLQIIGLDYETLRGDLMVSLGGIIRLCEKVIYFDVNTTFYEDFFTDCVSS